MGKKEIVYLGTLLIGMLVLIFGLTHDYLEGERVYYGLSDVIVILVGSITAIVGLALLIGYKIRPAKFARLHKTTKILGIFLLCGLAIIAVYAGTSLYGQLQLLKYASESQKPIQESLFNEMYCKKVIIRNDDPGGPVDPALEWLSNLTMEKNIKATYAVIPALLRNHSETIYYLRNLDKQHFEIATHGLTHEQFRGMPYNEQYSLIENATRIIEDCLQVRPVTFIPPTGLGDTQTSKACRALGYHSITDVKPPITYTVNFVTDFSWESSYHPIKLHNFKDFKENFDTFYNSSDDFYVLLLHHWTFLNESYESFSQVTGAEELNETLTSQFEKSIDYMKIKNVEFMTIEEAYEWYVDKEDIRWGKVNENTYFIDLAACQYNHTIKFELPTGWQGNVEVIDVSTGDRIGAYIDKGIFEFKGERGHCYEIKG